MLVILLNCVTLGMFQPCEDVECQSERCTILEVRSPCCPMCLGFVGCRGVAIPGAGTPILSLFPRIQPWKPFP